MLHSTEEERSRSMCDRTGAHDAVRREQSVVLNAVVLLPLKKTEGEKN